MADSKIESFHITGNGKHYQGDVNVLVDTMKESIVLFAKSQGRLPDERESSLIWVAVQRWHQVPEDCVMPEELRRQ